MNCAYCKKDFVPKDNSPSHLLRYPPKYCSRACRDVSRTKFYVCSFCGSSFRPKNRQYKKYCSKRCAGKSRIGIPRPDWVRKKVSASKIGIKLTLQHRLSLSKAHLGIKPSKKCIEILKSQTGEKHPGWKGGRKKLVNGYISISSYNHPNADCDGRILEHRLVMEKHIGRLLRPEEVVHHKNRIKSDNRIENLVLLPSNSAHRKLHALERHIKFDNGKATGT